MSTERKDMHQLYELYERSNGQKAIDFVDLFACQRLERLGYVTISQHSVTITAAGRAAWEAYRKRGF